MNATPRLSGLRKSRCLPEVGPIQALASVLPTAPRAAWQLRQRPTALGASQLEAEAANHAGYVFEEPGVS